MGLASESNSVPPPRPSLQPPPDSGFSAIAHRTVNLDWHRTKGQG